jgi:hypothetical protein
MASVISATRCAPGDQRDAVRARVVIGELQGGRVQMRAVVDELDGDPLVLQEGGDGAGCAVAERRHRVVQVRGDGGAGVDRLDGLLVRGVRVPDRGDDAVLGEQPYGVDAAGQFGGEREHLRGAARRVHQLADLGRVRMAQQVLAVGALAAGGDEGALEVDAGQVALFDQFGEDAGAFGEEVHLAGDGGGDQGGGAVLAVGADAGEDLVHGAGGEGRAAAAVVVHVHEAGNDPVAGQVDGRGALRRTSGDAGAFDDHPAVLDGAGGEYHPGP